MRPHVTRNLTRLFHHVLSLQEFRSTPEGDGQPSQPSIKAKPFISSHKKAQIFSPERRSGFTILGKPCVWGAGRWGLVGPQLPTQEAHQMQAVKSQAPSYQLPAPWLCSLVQIVKGQNKKKKSFLEVRSCAGLLDCTSQTQVLWPGLTLNPPCKQSELVPSQVTCVQSEHNQQVARTMDKN